MRALKIPQTWPFRAASRHVACRPHLWHVQEIGAGPTLLLIHGAGGATHSWRNLIPLLAPHYRVIAVDLPGQGFTVLGDRSRCGLDATAADIAALVAHEGWQVSGIIGHSAGAAIALRLAETMKLSAVVGINAALSRFEGMAGWLFPAIAKLLAITPLVPQIFSRLGGTPAQVHQLLTSTGSQIEPAGEAQYLHLVRMSSHVDATLTMMAQWVLDAMLSRLARQTVPCLLITGSNDRAVPPAVSRKAASVIPSAQLASCAGFGHLLHEEAAAQTAALILPFLAQCGVAAPNPTQHPQ